LESPWLAALQAERQKNEAAVAELAGSDAAPMNLYRMFKDLSEVIANDAIVAIDGENTMAVSRAMLPNYLPRHRLDAGVSGYIHMDATSEEFISAVRGASASANASITGKVSLVISRETLLRLNGEDDGVLSDREREVLELTARAMSNAQIARRLTITEATVKRHMTNIFNKLGAVSRIDAVNKATTANLIRVPGVLFWQASAGGRPASGL